MTAEELAEVLKAVNANRPQVTQTMNFNAPIGQQIAHVDKIEAHFDKDMGMQITNADEVSKQGGSDSDAIPSDPLILYIFDDNERRKVVSGLQACKDTGQVASFAKILWEEEIVKYDVLRGSDFHRAIKPLLNFETTENAIKQAILKQVKTND